MENTQVLNPIPPELRDLIVDACGALGEFKSTRSDVEEAASDGHSALLELWFTNPSDPWDDEVPDHLYRMRQVRLAIVSRPDLYSLNGETVTFVENPKIAAPDLGAVMSSVRTAVDGLRAFRRHDGEVDEFRSEAIAKADRFLTLGTEIASNDQGFLGAMGIQA